MNSLVRDVTPVMLVSILAVFQQGSIKEHISTKKNSHIFKHLKQSKISSQKYSPNCFKILDKVVILLIQEKKRKKKEKKLYLYSDFLEFLRS